MAVFDKCEIQSKPLGRWRSCGGGVVAIGTSDDELPPPPALQNPRRWVLTACTGTAYWCRCTICRLYNEWLIADWIGFDVDASIPQTIFHGHFCRAIRGNANRKEYCACNEKEREKPVDLQLMPFEDWACLRLVADTINGHGVACASFASNSRFCLRIYIVFCTSY